MKITDSGCGRWLSPDLPVFCNCIGSQDWIYSWLLLQVELVSSGPLYPSCLIQSHSCGICCSRYSSLPQGNFGLGYWLCSESVNPVLDSPLQKSLGWSWTWKGFWYQSTALEVSGWVHPNLQRTCLVPQRSQDGTWTHRVPGSCLFPLMSQTNA